MWIQIWKYLGDLPVHIKNVGDPPSPDAISKTSRLMPHISDIFTYDVGNDHHNSDGYMYVFGEKERLK